MAASVQKDAENQQMSQGMSQLTLFNEKIIILQDISQFPFKAIKDPKQHMATRKEAGIENSKIVVYSHFRQG